MEFFRQEYWNGLPFPSPGNLPDPGIEPGSSAMQADSPEPPGEFNPIISWQIDGETVETVSDYFFGAPKSLQMVTAAMKLKDAYSLEEK